MITPSLKQRDFQYLCRQSTPGEAPYAPGQGRSIKIPEVQTSQPNGIGPGSKAKGAEQ